MVYKKILWLIMLVAVSSSSTGLVVLDSKQSGSLQAAEQIRYVSGYYGIEITHLFLDKNDNLKSVAQYLQSNSPQGIIITEAAISLLSPKALTGIMNKKGFGSKIPPIMILGVTSNTKDTALAQWSQGTISGVSGGLGVKDSARFDIACIENLTSELSGLEIPGLGGKYPEQFLFEMKKDNRLKPIIKLKANNKVPLARFAVLQTGGGEIFFQASIGKRADSFSYQDWYYNKLHLIEFLPLFIFMKHACQEKCWRSPADFANFTIDDPWLVERYGYLDYNNLLAQMRNVGFHTTIAFIPWNFDRCKPDVVTLFKQNPTCYSLCFHGNNHDHKEFGFYKDKSIDKQEENIRIALRRMAKMAELTGLYCDKVMVFPQGIAPSRTLLLLKKYNFLSTINGSNIPLGEEETNAGLDYPVTLAYENFASVKRYPASKVLGTDEKVRIAIDLFLGNPVLIYAHHDFFRGGIDCFNKVAKWMNSIEPELKWEGLGDISKHLYRQRLRNDSTYDILSYSSSITIENQRNRVVTYRISKPESFNLPIKDVMVEGKPYGFDTKPDTVVVLFSVPPNESHHLEITYSNSLDKEVVPITKTGLRIALLRYSSDIRDIVLPRFPLGSDFVKWYGKVGLNRQGLLVIAILALIVIVAGAFAWILLVAANRRKSVRKDPGKQ